MIAIFGLLSFSMSIIFFILFVVAVIRKKSKRTQGIIALGSFIVCVILMVVSPTPTDLPDTKTPIVTATSEPQSNIEDNIVEIKTFVGEIGEDIGGVTYWVIISDSYDWNNRSYNEQGRFAQEAVMLYREKAKEDGYDKVYIYGMLEDDDMAFHCGNDSHEIGIWIDGMLKKKWSLQ